MGVSIGRLRRRQEFLQVAETRRKIATPGLILQARRRDAAATPDGVAPDSARLGFTATRKIGGAVARNRARRRLRAAAQAVMPEAGRAGWDYVLVARTGTLSRRFPDLMGDLRRALATIERERRGK